MRSHGELERMWRESPPAPRGRGLVRLICVRAGNGVHECPEKVLVTPEGGVDGDRWTARPDRSAEQQVTVMSARVAELVTGDHAPLHAAGDNFLVHLDLSEEALPAGTRLRMGGALFEVSLAPHTGCKKFRERFGLDAMTWVNEPAQREQRVRGMNCRVLRAGVVAVGDPIEVDRTASAGADASASDSNQVQPSSRLP